MGTTRCPDWRHPRLPYTWDRYAGKDRAPEWSHMEPGVLMAVVGAKSTRSRPLCVAVGCSIHASEPGPINRYVTPQSTRWLLRKPLLCVHCASLKERLKLRGERRWFVFFQFFVRQVTHHLPEGTAPHRLHPPPLARIDENPSLDPGSD